MPLLIVLLFAIVSAVLTVTGDLDWPWYYSVLPLGAVVFIIVVCLLLSKACYLAADIIDELDRRK